MRSPDNKCTDTPSFDSRLTTHGASERRCSTRSNRANSVVWPSANCSANTTCNASRPSCAATPAWTAEPSRRRRCGCTPVVSFTVATSPSPASSCKCVTAQRAPSADAADAAATTARDAGCMDWRARAAARDNTSSAAQPGAVCTDCSAMPSRVSVPVLSNTTVSTPASASSPCRLHTNTPWRASVPAAVNMATGVASDSAHGQVTMSTATATINAWPGSEGHQYTAANTAAKSTATRKGLAMRSASCAKRGFCSDALSISATICANRVCPPVPSTSTSTGACRL
ncbi:hypothetical protein D3C71_1477760 [compost metagenome]